jgi:hypothetical protein
MGIVYSREKGRKGVNKMDNGVDEDLKMLTTILATDN